MKLSLKLSLMVNLGLVVLAVCLMRSLRRGAEDRSVPATSLHDTNSPAQEIIESAPLRSRPQPQPHFQWSQLESSDYRTYIANLRAIDCPEQTIRDIVTADLESNYSPHRDELRRKYQGIADPAILQLQLQQLAREQAAVLAALLGPAFPTETSSELASSNAIAAVAPVRRSRFANPPRNTASVPLVLQDPGPDIDLDAEQLGIIKELREDFNDAVKGLDPASAEYKQRWQEAQQTADQRMPALLGYSVWHDYLTHARSQQQPSP
jgi:hypothetical protein